MTNITLASLRDSLNANIVARIAYEDEKNPANTKGKVIARRFSFDFATNETKLTNESFKAFKAMGVESFDFINSQIKSDARMNIYAFEKIRAHLDSVRTGKLVAIDKTAQKYCVSILRDIIAHEKDYKAGSITIDLNRVKSMFSVACRSDALANYPKLSTLAQVEPSTAQSQSGSSLRALDALRVLDFYPETRKGKDAPMGIVTWVNWDHPLIALARDLFDIPAKQA
jgi:hypothetical protein